MRVWFVLLLMLSASTAIGAESQWHWIKTSNNVVKGWTVSEGNADISIQGDKFEAKLFWKDSDKDVRIVLKGTVRNGKIVVNEGVQESDQNGSTYHGALQRKKWDEFAGTIGAESITLTDGWGMIGITRAIPK